MLAELHSLLEALWEPPFLCLFQFLEACLSSSCSNKNNINGWLMNNKTSFLTALEAGSPRLGCQHSWVPLPGCRPLCPHMVESREQASSPLTLTRTLTPFMRTPPSWPYLILTTSQRPHLLISSCDRVVGAQWGFSTWILWGHQHSVCYKAPSFLTGVPLFPLLTASRITSLWPYLHHHVSFSSSVPPSSTFQDPCDYLGPTRIIQDNLLIWRSAA